jgi:acyl-CoA synthetase (AMP-forming)/AMP-acid ligase II
LLTSGLHNNMGVANLLAALLNGGAGVVMRRFDPAHYGDWLDRYQPTWTVTTSTELTMVLDAAAAAGREEVAGPRSRLRAVRAGAQALAPGVAERVERSLRTLVFDGFGMTEASYIAGDGPAAADRRPGACGRPIAATIRILDGSGNALPAGDTGDVVIRGPTLFSGYLDDPAATAAAFLPGGWFRTGDLGYLDGDGYLHLTGRASELINRGGEKIAPLEVDHALLQHPQVAEAAAFAVPDERLGEDVVAAVVLAPGSAISARQLRTWLLDRLSPARAPRRIWFVECLPRTPNGKVQRGELARRWREEQA